MKLWWKEWRNPMGEVEGRGEARGLTEARGASTIGASRGARERGDRGGEGHAGEDTFFGASPPRAFETDGCTLDPC